MEVENTYNSLFTNVPCIFNELPFDTKRVIALYSSTPSASVIKKLPLSYEIKNYFYIRRIKLFLKKISPQLLQTYPYQNLVLTIGDPTCYTTLYLPLLYILLKNKMENEITGLTMEKKRELIIPVLKENGFVFEKSESLGWLEAYLWYHITTLQKVKPPKPNSIYFY
jgi:hypothetical protein